MNTIRSLALSVSIAILCAPAHTWAQGMAINSTGAAANA